MSSGVQLYIAHRQAEAEAARIVGEALHQARALLRAAEVEDEDSIMEAIWEASLEE